MIVKGHYKFINQVLPVLLTGRFLLPGFTSGMPVLHIGQFAAS